MGSGGTAGREQPRGAREDQVVADAAGFSVTLVAAAVVFALVTAALAATPFRAVRSPV